MNDLTIIVGTLALAGLVSLVLLAFVVYGCLAVLEALGVVKVGTADLIVYRCIEPSERRAL